MELIERLGRSSCTQSGSLFAGVFQSIRGFIKKKNHVATLSTMVNKKKTGLEALPVKCEKLE